MHMRYNVDVDLHQEDEDGASEARMDINQMYYTEKYQEEGDMEHGNITINYLY